MLEIASELSPFLHDWKDYAVIPINNTENQQIFRLSIFFRSDQVQTLNKFDFNFKSFVFLFDLNLMRCELNRSMNQAEQQQFYFKMEMSLTN